jgi:hypothetical protein
MKMAACPAVPGSLKEQRMAALFEVPVDNIAINPIPLSSPGHDKTNPDCISTSCRI